MAHRGVRNVEGLNVERCSGGRAVKFGLSTFLCFSSPLDASASDRSQSPRTAPTDRARESRRDPAENLHATVLRVSWAD